MRNDNVHVSFIRQIYTQSFFRSASIYTFSNAMASGIPFFIMPVLTHYLAPADFGTLTVFQVLIGVVSPFIGLNLHGAISRIFFESERIDLAQYLGNCLILYALGTFSVFVVVLVCRVELAELLNLPASPFLLLPIIAAGQFLTILLLTLWQMENRPALYGMFQLGFTVANILLCLWFVIGLGLGWLGSLLAQLVTFVTFGIIGLGLLCNNCAVSFKYNPKYIKHALGFGVPLIPHTLSATMFGVTDKLFLSNILGLTDTGIYAIGYQIGMIIALLQNSFNQAWIPWLFAKLKDCGHVAKLRIVQLTYLYFALIVLAALLLSLISPWILALFVGSKYAGAAPYIIWISLGFAFNGMYKMVVGYIYYSEKTLILFWISLITAIINVVLNYYLIHFNGVIGAAQATALTFLISFLLTWAFAIRIYPMPWKMPIVGIVSRWIRL